MDIDYDWRFSPPGDSLNEGGSFEGPVNVVYYPDGSEFRMALMEGKGGYEGLTALAEEVDDWPILWRNIATLRGWKADVPGCIEALAVQLRLGDVDLVFAECIDECDLLRGDGVPARFEIDSVEFGTTGDSVRGRQKTAVRQ